MVLLEREPQLAQLHQLYTAIEEDSPQLVLLSGEAGVGKTVLLKQYRDEVLARGGTVVWGMCDDLYTPQALAPFYDVAYQLGGALIDLLPEATNLHLIGHRLLNTLSSQHSPVVLVIEDIHWADEATLDLIRYLGRRLDGRAIMLILTLREQTYISKALQVLLGALPANLTTRIGLRPFEPKTVNRLAGEMSIDLENLFQLTQGNPFYVTEMLKSQSDQMPETIRDAILGRVASLSQEARMIVEIVSLIPNQAEVWLAEQLGYRLDSLSGDLLLGNILEYRADYLAFRHELARRIVHDALPIQRRKLLHREIFDVLLARRKTSDIHLARLVHHAAYAELGEAVIQLAPKAAQQAQKVNAYREAAAHYATVLQYRDLMPEDQAASLLEARADCSFYNDWEVALSTLKKAQTIRRKLDDRYRLGVNYRQMARLAWGTSQIREARQYSLRAIRLLKEFDDGEALAEAYLQLNQIHTVTGHFSAAKFWNRVALAYSERIDAAEPYLDALLNLGIILGDTGDFAGAQSRFDQVLEIATDQNRPLQIVRVYINRVLSELHQLDLQKGLSLCEIGAQFALEHEMEIYRQYFAVLKGRVLIHLGRWDEALALSRPVVDVTPLGPIGVTGLTNIALVEARRGDLAAKLTLKRLDKLLDSGRLEPRLINDIYLAWAEVAWHEGDYAECQRQIDLLLKNITRTQEDDWFKRGHGLHWLWRCGKASSIKVPMPYPIQLELSGAWQQAAESWAASGFLYEAGLAYAFGDRSGLSQAFEIFDQLNARPALDFVRKSMREIGVAVPRGANASTRQNKIGLTKRQMEVLTLLAQDLTNAEIGSRLHISAKTAEHHVSAILGKLDVASRDEAAATARANGLI